jgi:hypothetical protein
MTGVEKLSDFSVASLLCVIPTAVIVLTGRDTKKDGP